MENLTDLLNITYNNIRPQKGKVLISQPFMWDGCFSRSVVLILDYSEKGTIGFILNKWLQQAIDEVVGYSPAEKLQLSLGGPLATNTLHYIHSFDNIPFAIEIAKGLYYGGDLRQVLSQSIMKPENIRFFIGYAGWTGGQLDKELKTNSWLVGDIQPSQVFRQSNNLWRDSVRNMDDKYWIWTTFPENPAYN